MTRSIYTRILVWFWLANAGITLSILAITLMSGAQPLGRRWLAASLELYAQTATDAYRSGGAAALNAYLDHIQASVSMRAVLLGPGGETLSAHTVPPGSLPIVEQVRATGKPHFHFGARWLGTSIVHTPQGDYVFIAQVDALRRFSRQLGAGGLVLKALAAMLAGCLLCWLLARSITAPIRTLQSAVRSLGEGDLSVRVSPKIPPRNDELTDLAHEFDRMAAQIESLRNEQHRLLADISHELRSPLTRLSISTELASRGDLESLERMRKDITALDQLIEQVLTLTRLEIQQQTRVQSNTPLNKVLTALVDDADFEAREQGKSVILQPQQPCSVRGEPGLLRSCLENVIRNAVRFTPAATAVRVLVETGQRNKKPVAIVTVEDQGR
ncbi:MAG: two-component system, OmpR family, sensor histidine kinase CpxA, partial [Acidobacteriaceae bacterium]|nr:two-component system, OmpR family, sensor histidine kinase CpxA [Acidobacteriaceae bacterium]